MSMKESMTRKGSTGKITMGGEKTVPILLQNRLPLQSFGSDKETGIVGALWGRLTFSNGRQLAEMMNLPEVQFYKKIEVQFYRLWQIQMRNLLNLSLRPCPHWDFYSRDLNPVVEITLWICASNHRSFFRANFTYVQYIIQVECKCHYVSTNKQRTTKLLYANALSVFLLTLDTYRQTKANNNAYDISLHE